MKQRILNILIAFDQLIYALVTLGYGSPLETLSAAAYRMELEGHHARVFRPLIDWLFGPLEAHHCRKALVTPESALDLDYSSHGPIPYTVPELREEMGL